MHAHFPRSRCRRFRRAGHALRDFKSNYQNGNLLFQQAVGGVSTGFLENSPNTHYYWLPTPQGDILVGFDQGANSYAVYTDHLGTPRLVTKIDNPQNPKPITDTSNDLPPADYDQPEGISPMAIPVWQWSYSPFGADLANGYEARPTTMVNNFKPDLWSWMGLPETGGADANQVAQETWRIQVNLTTPPMLNIRYPGQYYDFESGLMQNWWRTYEPRIGRYVSADPIGLEGGWNRFTYSNQDGINQYDPYGLETIILIPPREKLTFAAALLYPGSPGVLTIISHGTPSTVNKKSPEQLAQLIQSLATWRAGDHRPVLLNACNSGKGGQESYAAKLAKILGVPVTGATTQTWNIGIKDIGPYEPTYSGDAQNLFRPGRWETFAP